VVGCFEYGHELYASVKSCNIFDRVIDHQISREDCSMEFVSEKNYVYIKISILRVDWLPYARHLPHCCGKPSVTALRKIVY
jgi:hypothetical protein